MSKINFLSLPQLSSVQHGSVLSLGHICAVLVDPKRSRTDDSQSQGTPSEEAVSEFVARAIKRLGKLRVSLIPQVHFYPLLFVKYVATATYISQAACAGHRTIFHLQYLLCKVFQQDSILHRAKLTPIMAELPRAIKIFFSSKCKIYCQTNQGLSVSI